MTDAPLNLCACCNRAFRARSQTPRQAYCGRIACQRERRRRWQRAKRLTDPDYRTNQRKSQRAWSLRHPKYWADYRRRRPNYCERNRFQQRVRRQAGAHTLYVKVSAPQRAASLSAGVYRLIPVRGKFAKKDAWDTEIRWIPVLVGVGRKRCKETMK